MRIADVLTSKTRPGLVPGGGSGVVTMLTAHTVQDAVRLFDAHHVSSVVVVDPQRRPLGLVSDRDVVHALARRGAGALQSRVTDIMISPPPACTPEMTVTQGLARMTLGRVRHLVVLGEEEMLGIVSIGDLVKARLDDADLEGRVLRDMALGHIAAA
jgi:CBS domain-containing protein